MAFVTLNLLTFDGTKQVRVPTNTASVIFKGIQVTDPPVNPYDVPNLSYVTTAISEATGSVDLSAYLKKDGTVAMTGILDLGTHKISNVVDPVGAQDAATKNYVDTSTGNAANKSLSNLTSPTAVNQDLNLSGHKLNHVAEINNNNPAFVSAFSFTASGSTVDLTNNWLVYAGHGLTSAMAIQFSGSGLPAPLVAATTYYARVAFGQGPDKIEIYTDSGLTSQVVLTSVGSGLVSVTKYSAGAGVLAVTSDIDATAKTITAGYVRASAIMDPTSNAFIVDLGNKALENSSGTTMFTWEAGPAFNASVDMQNNSIENLPDPTTDQQAATKKYVDDADALFVKKDGTVAMTGALDLGTHKINNVVDPTSAQDAATKKYVDDSIGAIPAPDFSPYVKHDGTVAMTGALDLGTHKINNVVDPTSAQDAATKKYVDDADALFVKKDGTVAMTGALDLGTHKINNVVDPTANQDAATKKYVDDSVGAIDLTPYVKLDGTASMTGSLNMGTHTITSVVDPTNAQDAATKNYVDTQDGQFVKKDGTVAMTGALDLGTHKINNVVDPTAAQDAATKSFVDTQDALKLSLSGGTMTGNIAMATNKITGLGNGVNAGDAVNKSQLDAITSGLVWKDPILDPNFFDDSLSSPPVSPAPEDLYLVGASASGLWAGLEGHLVESADGGTTWNDKLGRAVVVGDRLGICLESAHTPAGGLAGKQFYIANITNATPGSYAYTFDAPVNREAVFVNNPSSYHFGHSYTYNSDLAAWIEFSGPASIGAGIGLAWAGNTLNVNLGAGIQQLPTDEVGIDLYSSSGLALVDPSTGLTSTAPDAQISLKLDGGTLAKSSSGAKVANASLSDTQMVASGISGASIRLANDQTLRARNAAGSADVDLFKLTTADVFTILGPMTTQDMTPGTDAANAVGTYSLRYGQVWTDFLSASSSIALRTPDISSSPIIGFSSTGGGGTPDGTSGTHVAVRGPTVGLSYTSFGFFGRADANNDATATLPMIIGTGQKSDPGASGASGEVRLASGNVAGSGNSGPIRLKPGSVGSGTKGTVIIDSTSLDMTSNKIINVADPVSAQDAATKNYIDGNFANRALSNLQTVAINQPLFTFAPGVSPTVAGADGVGTSTSGVIFRSGAITSGTNSNTTGTAFFGSGSLSTTGAGVTGALTGGVTVRSGNIITGDGSTGDMVVRAGDTVAFFTGNTGAFTARSGNALGVGNSGNAFFASGTTANGASGTAFYRSGDAIGGASGQTGIRSGHVTGNATSGLMSVNSGNSSAGSSGNVLVYSGNAAAGTSGNVTINAGQALTGGNVGITGGNSTGTAQGGNVNINSGTAAANYNSGNISIGTPAASGSGNAGSIMLNGGQATGTGIGGSVNVVSGTGATGGSMYISSGNSTGANPGGFLNISSGSAATDYNSGGVILHSNNASGTGQSGGVSVFSGNTVNGNASSVNISGGSSTGTGNGGDVQIGAGGSSGSGNGGNASLNAGSGVTGGNVLVNAGGSSGSAAGGNINMSSGSAATNFNTGSINLNTQNATGTGQSGSIGIAAGQSVNGNAGNTFLNAGTATGSGNGGNAGVNGGNANGSGFGGNANIYAGNGGTGGNAFFVAGNSTGSNPGGYVQINGGNAPSGQNSGGINLGTQSALGSGQSGSIGLNVGQSVNGNAGNINFSAGQSTGSGAGGNIGFGAGSSSSGVGGNINLNAGSGDQGGTIGIGAGTSTGSFQGGSINIVSGQAATNQSSGGLFFNTFDATGTGNSGSIQLRTGNVASGFQGQVEIHAPVLGHYGSNVVFYGNGPGNVNVNTSGAMSGTATQGMNISTGGADAANSGSISIQPGFVSTSGTAGSVNISSGGAASGGVAGDININTATNGTNFGNITVAGKGVTMNGNANGGTFTVQNFANASFGGLQINNLADPTSAQDAATKAYVDAYAAGLGVRKTCKAATVSALPSYTGSGGILTSTTNVAIGTIDGYSPSVNDRILVKDETGADKKWNGIYDVTAVGSGAAPWVLTRSSDYDSTAATEVKAGSFVFIENGSTQKAHGYVEILSVTTINSSDIEFAQFSAAGSYSAGDGIKITGQSIAVDFGRDLTNNESSNSISNRDFVYINSAGGVKLVIADGTISSLSDATQFGISRTASSIGPAGTANVTFKSGDVVGGFSGLTVNSPVYASRTVLGGYQQDLTGFVSGNQVINIGRAISSTEVHFSPSFAFVY